MGKRDLDRPLQLTAVDGRGGAKSAVRAGFVRIALALLGLCTTLLMPGLSSCRALLVAYLLLAFLFQWAIGQRAFRSSTRAIAMGIVDLSVLSVMVHQIGTASVVPIAYVAIPVLYATTTRRRRVSVVISIVGMLMYVLLVLLESLELIAYAPATPGMPVPDAMTRLASVLLVGICGTGTAVLTSQLINALGAANARLRDLSQHDELTGLYNRRYVMQRMEDELARIKRKADPLTVAMVDLDGFKRVNDEEGHEAGDAVLKAVAGALLSATRRADVVARYGGDEFVILFPGTELEGARAVASRILDQARSAAREVCPVIPISASIGTTAVHVQDEPAEVIRRVDELLYAAKRAGGDRIHHTG